jgi:ribonuclease T1
MRLLQIFLATVGLLFLTAVANAADFGSFCREKKLDCSELTAAVEAIRSSGRLPEKFITKKAAKKLGWQPGTDLASVAPGKSIGGDRFGNFEKRLPVKKGRQWYEADLSFKRGKRGAKRLLFSSDRLIYVTTDHYKTFQEVPP